MRVELFATGAASPGALWSVVGDPWRLAEWTDADEVAAVAPEPLQPGSEIVVLVGGAELSWRVRTVEPRLLEAETATARGRLGVGVRVTADPRGSRLVLAGFVEPTGLGGRLRARLVDVPGLRRRFDRWMAAAMAAART